MCRRADVMQARDRRLVIDRRVKRPPQEELIDAAEAAIGIATDQIDIERFKIGR